MSVKFYSVSDECISYLIKCDKRVLSNHQSDRKYKRPYIGFLFKINEHDYFIPLSSPSENDYSGGSLKCSTTTIIRMINRKGAFIGKILINNMIPVPTSELEMIDIECCDKKYSNLLIDEKNWIESNLKKIRRSAEVVYCLKINEKKAAYWEKRRKPGFLNSTVDFELLECSLQSFVAEKPR